MKWNIMHKQGQLTVIRDNFTFEILLFMKQIEYKRKGFGSCTEVYHLRVIYK